MKSKKVIFLTQASHSKFTRGKRMPGIREYNYTREFLEQLAYFNDVDCCAPLDIENITPGSYALQSIKKQAEFINYIVKMEKREMAFMEVHLNASGKGEKWYKANGSVIWISKRASKKSKLFAECMLNSLKIMSPYTQIHTRRGIKQRNHTITTATKCPAILLELGFMTSLEEVAKLRKNIAYLVNAVHDGQSCYQSEIMGE